MAIEFTVQMMALAHMISLDQYNLYNSASVEIVARRLLMIMPAVKRNPRAPDFEGLDAFLSTATDSSGVVASLDFDKYIADSQKNGAVIMKQNRILKEEHEAAAKKKGKPSGAANGA